MSQLASPSQLRMSLLRWALFVVPLIMFLGWLSGTISGSAEDNAWYAELVKPDAQPPGWVFGVVWPLLYLMTGIALAIVLNARGAALRMVGVGLFLLQFVLNLAWSPLFFGQHEVTKAFYLLILILTVAIGTTFVFGRIRAVAAWLMVPYLAWLCFASILNYQIDVKNENAKTLYIPSVPSQIGN
jgi:translocator protein